MSDSAPVSALSLVPARVFLLVLIADVVVVIIVDDDDDVVVLSTHTTIFVSLWALNLISVSSGRGGAVLVLSELESMAARQQREIAQQRRLLEQREARLAVLRGAQVSLVVSHRFHLIILFLSFSAALPLPRHLLCLFRLLHAGSGDALHA